MSNTERARRHMGGLVTIRAAAEDTNGSLAVVEERAARGYTTPPHVHSREDETLFVIEGTLDYAVNGVPGTATAGEAVFLPRGLPHTFSVTSQDAHFLVIITPGGFEQFFTEVSPPASATNQPGTDPARMVTSAADFGTTVFGSDEPVIAAADIVGTSTTPSSITDAYRVIEDAVAGVGPLPSRLDAVTDRLLDVAATRLTDHPVHAQSLILLGILAERAEPAWQDRLPELLRTVRPDWPEAVALAAAYLFAHFPSDTSAIESALAATVLAEPDRARLRRCLTRPGPTALDQLGRVWPSPATWTLDPADRALDRRWRSTLDLTTETVAALWHSETTALLAFMGARAAHAVERSCRA